MERSTWKSQRQRIAPPVALHLAAHLLGFLRDVYANGKVGSRPEAFVVLLTGESAMAEWPGGSKGSVGLLLLQGKAKQLSYGAAKGRATHYQYIKLLHTYPEAASPPLNQLTNPPRRP